MVITFPFSFQPAIIFGTGTLVAFLTSSVAKVNVTSASSDNSSSTASVITYLSPINQVCVSGSLYPSFRLLLNGKESRA
ncbi:hypothetical protein PC116_g31205 [Phytophthora cactorum]|nr:hypothetical protein PC116_g31205 [Phytophthora cactorum]